MITNNIDYDLVLKFMKSSESFFEKQLVNNGLTMEGYAKKFAELSTVSYRLEGDSIVGAVIGYTQNTPNNYSYITQVYVNRDKRGCGIADVLLKDYITYCKSINLSGIWLTTEIFNDKAQNLYKKNGFVFVDKKNELLVKMQLDF